MPTSCAAAHIYSYQSRPIPRHSGRCGKGAEEHANRKEGRYRQGREESNEDKEVVQENVVLVEVQACKVRA